MFRMLACCLFAIQCLPNASVQLAVPLSTMSMIVANALAERRSVGEMKLPAALLSRASTWPNRSTELVRSRSRSEEHTSELQSRENLVCRLLLEKKKKYMK